MVNTIIAKDKWHLLKLIEEHVKREGNECDLNHIDTSLITDMSHLFCESKFKGDISQWDTSNVTDMSYMFADSSFNGDISKWNTSNVEDMSSMFACSEFNRDISKWDVSQVNDMTYMFFYSKFNTDISDWNVLNAEHMDKIFSNCQSLQIPYWAKIEDFYRRQKAVLEYQDTRNNKKEIEKIIPNENEGVVKKYAKTKFNQIYRKTFG